MRILALPFDFVDRRSAHAQDMTFLATRTVNYQSLSPDGHIIVNVGDYHAA